MQFKLILRRDDGSRAQLAVTADATSSVSDLATALAIGDPERRAAHQPGNPTLKLEQNSFDTGISGRVLDPSRSLLDSGMRSGSTVSIAATQAAATRTRRGRAVAMLRILEGPDRGREFPLAAGNSSIGTGITCDVVLTDPAVADVHAALVVGESIEVSNLAGPSGVILGGRPVQRGAVGVSDVVQLGNTHLAVVHTVRPGTAQSDSVAIEFNRSPRVVTRYGEHKFDAPKAPQQPDPAHFPVLSMLLPLVMGLVLFAVTRSLLAVVFIALSPLLMLGMYFDTKFQARKKYRQSVERFAASLRKLAADLTTAQRIERAVRLSETPALAEVVEAMHRLGPLLWTHRPEHPEFLTVRIGLGDAASRCRVERDQDREADPQYLTQLDELCEEFGQISDVPIVADLRECGALGICGPRGLVDGVARGIVMQLVGLHSPAELAVAAFSSAQTHASWEWLEWLPHTGSAHSPLAGNHLTESENGGLALLSRLEDLVKRRLDELPAGTDPGFGIIGDQAAMPAGPSRAAGPLPAVAVLVEDTAPIDRARLTRLAERGVTVGVHTIWVATQVSSLPAACRTFLLVDNVTDGSTVGEVRHGRHTFPVACDTLDIPDANQVALLLAPVVDVGAAVEDDTDLPRSLAYLSVAESGLATDPAVVGRQWIANESVKSRNGRMQPLDRPSTLRALIGSTGSAPFYIDLREQGPHALVGGTTGAGKSEFLQSWLMGMATAHSPDRVTFLLVDYKGGTAFAECVQLPHTVGLVTDLNPHLVRRALTSLRAELRRREEILNDKGAKDLLSLEQTGDPEAPPSLVIVVDEFAALAGEVPEFVDGMIDVAQRGRSLGLHLILATQRPAGVIKDNLRANTNLRIALRLNDVDDSLDVIDDAMAAHFPPEIPGRAVAKTGPGRLTTFQSGYVGGRSGDERTQSPIDVCEFAFGRRRPWHTTLSAGKSAHRAAAPTDITRIVSTVRTAAAQLSIPAPRKPWLEPLGETYALEKLTGQARDGLLVIGQGDTPNTQSQLVGCFNPDRDGNMAIIGTGGTGKSTALRTLAISAALAGDGPVHVYGFDFGSGSLRMLEPLPHIAAIVDGDDDERIGRVLRRLTALLEGRARAFARVHASSIGEYRRLAVASEPRILLLIDGVGAFRDTYEHTTHTASFGMLSQLVSDGRMLGIHVVVTGDRPGALSTSLSSAIQRRLVLRLATDDDYILAGVPNDILSTHSPRGRGIMDGQELQVAVFGGDSNVAVQGSAIERLAELMREKGFTAPEPVLSLAERIPLDTLPAVAADGAPAIGLSDQALAPIGVAPQGVLMVTGPPGSGRTTTLLTLAQAVRRNRPGARVIYLAPTTSTASSLDVWTERATNPSAVVDLAGRLIFGFGADTANLMVVIESVADFTGTEAESELGRMIKILAEAGAFIVGESEVSTWSQAWLLAQPFKSARRGLLLCPSGVESDSLLNTPIGPVRRNDSPPGRGVLIQKGKGVWIQVAQPVL